MRAIAVDDLEGLARALRELPAGGPLPARTVLVPSERMAHALRRLLVREPRAGGGPSPLAGTRIATPFQAAREVLFAAGRSFTTGESALRPARIDRRLREGFPLSRLDSSRLASTPGWGEAFARAIHLVESAGLRPGDLPAEVPELLDLSTLWAAVDGEAGASFTAARLFAEAAALLEADRRLWPWPGPVLVAADGHEPDALARLLRAVPEAVVAIRRALPARSPWVEGVRRKLGEEAASRLEAPGRPGAPGSELARLKAGLFHLGGTHAAGAGGPDGTVDLEEHAGVASELEDTAAWVARRILAGTPLHEVAVLVPALDPHASLVASRLERLGVPVHVAGGLPALATAAGARVLAVVEALRARLPVGRMPSVLAFLALTREAGAGEPGRAHLSAGETLGLAYGLGTAGGTPATPEGALAWSERAREREAEIRARVEQLRAESPGSRDVEEAERRLSDLVAARPALDALVDVARAVLEGAPLPVLWGRLRELLEEQVRLPPLPAWRRDAGDPPMLVPLLHARVAAMGDSALGAELRGDEALDAIAGALATLRLRRGRFGDPAVHVGTIAALSGLPFASVRIAGLAEGSVPPAPREDPLLPGPIRARLPLPVADPADRATRALHAFHGAVHGAGLTLSLSSPRVDLAGSEREPAAVLVEVAAALARPHAHTGAPGEAVPDGRALRRDAFEPARRSAAAFRRDHPVAPAFWLDRVAAGLREVPPDWLADPLLDLGRLSARRTPEPPVRLGRADGLLDPGPGLPDLPGLASSRPISATALGDLLACPLRFLMGRVLGWSEPGSAPSLHELDAMGFGSLLHRVLERLYAEHGERIVGGEGDLDRWWPVACEIADAELDLVLRETPLVGEQVRDQERRRLHRATRAFLVHDLETRSGRRFVAVERSFGSREAPLEIRAGDRPLHVLGRIDRIDVDGGRTLVRDLKSGKVYPREGRESDPTPERDVQIGVYQRVAGALAARWGTPPSVIAAYTYASGRGEVRQRAFTGEGDARALAGATDGWLALAGDLLASRTFVASPRVEDCRYCLFAPLCGSDEPRRAAAGLAAVGDGPLARFRLLKLGEGEEDDV